MPANLGTSLPTPRAVRSLTLYGTRQKQLLYAERTNAMTLPYTTDGWPASRPLYHTAYYKDETGITAVVSDWRDTLLFIVRRSYQDANFEAAQHPTSIDRLLHLEVVRRLQQEDWENGVTYQIDA